MATAPPEPAFRIDVRFLGGLSAVQQVAFETAAARWGRILSADVPSVVIDGETIDDVRIDAGAARIDGPGMILGRAGPIDLRPGSFIPATGVMSFDSADLAWMQADGSLVSVIVHEMGHVLGFGTIFGRLGLVIGTGGADPQFTGDNATREYAALLGPGPTPRSVPLANVGAPGTRDGHWREKVFANELMTGLLDVGANPISRVTIGAFEDLGYSVDYAAADAYRLPRATELLTLGRTRTARGHACVVEVPEQTVLPDSAILA
ncbi:MAG TPA: leishmanolysin-related zinc metalloendopeptidase [Solirubrobacteraceae bacterium]|nr:leishmanolysin-related zinc metalloendopeptidase [Solirubrobacteraceae bacterium]